MWMPSLVDRSGPKYLRIADAIAEDVYAGRLKVGERLPTHRDLAWRLGVTVGTVSRAYAEAERRGLVTGEVGRGSFVKAGARSQATLDMPAVGGPQTIELGVNRPPAHVIVDEFAKAMRRVADSNNLAELINYQAHTGRWEHRAAGAKWIRRRGVEVGPERVLVTSGAEHAITASLMAFSDPGDPILVEELTWSGVRALASLLRLSLRSVAMDEEGMIPEALEAVGRASGARLLYTTPTMHNPTTKTMSTERRRAIAEVSASWASPSSRTTSTAMSPRTRRRPWPASRPSAASTSPRRRRAWRRRCASASPPCRPTASGASAPPPGPPTGWRRLSWHRSWPTGSRTAPATCWPTA